MSEKKNYCIVYDFEVIEEPVAHGGAKQALLQVLQRKGAPVEGVIIHRADEVNYRWYSIRKMTERATIYKWERIPTRKITKPTSRRIKERYRRSSRYH